MIPGKQYRPEDFLHMAWRRRWFVVLPFVLIGVSTAVYARFLPNKYASETLILVVPQRVPESYVRSTVTTRIEDRLQTISQQILSRPRLEQIIQDFNLYPKERKTLLVDDLVERMRSKEIQVQVVKGDSFRVRYTADDPRTAMQVVERLASLFIDENLRDREVQAEGTSKFLEAQLEDARKRLIEQERRLSVYQREHSDDLPSQLNFNLQAQHNAEMQVQALLDSLAADRDRRLLLERQIADSAVATEPSAVPTKGDAAPQSASEQLAAAQATLAELETRLTPAHPDVVRTKRLVADLERKAAAEAAALGSATVPAIVSPARAARDNRLAELRVELANVTRQIAAKEDQERRLRGSIAQYQRRIEAAPGRASELAELTRDYDTIQQLYRNLLQKNEDSKISANLERRQVGEQFKVVEPANLPERPVSPNRLKLNITGAVAGLFLGIVIAAVLEYLDTSLRSERDVTAALQIPVLARVPLIVGEETALRRRRNWLVFGMTAVVTVALGLVGLVLKLKV